MTFRERIFKIIKELWALYNGYKDKELEKRDVEDKLSEVEKVLK